MLTGLLVLLFLLACASVANLMIARMVQRRRELATRSALGASRGALIWLVMAEVLVLAAASGLLGIVIARI